MTRHETIIAGRGDRKRTVRVERRRRAWTAAEIRGAGLTAVGDAQFRMGGALSGRDVARILSEGKPASDPVGKIDMGACRQPKGPACPSKPVGCQPREATKPENQADLSTGVLQNWSGPLVADRVRPPF